MVFTAHAGQGCALQTRMLVPHDKKAEVLDARRRGGAERCRRRPARGVDAGRAAHHRGAPRPRRRPRRRGRRRGRPPRRRRPPADGLERGWYYEPTVVDVDDNANPLAQREVFGPVLTVQGYGDVDEAVAIANDTEYGLSGGVYTDDLALGLDSPARIRSGHRAGQPRPASAFTPMGGYKQSGIGRERGVAGIREFQDSSTSSWAAADPVAASRGVAPTLAGPSARGYSRCSQLSRALKCQLTIASSRGSRMAQLAGDRYIVISSDGHAGGQMTSTGSTWSSGTSTSSTNGRSRT